MNYEIFNMDCRDALDLYVESNSVQMCVTSPPYFGLRDYGVDGQLGLEPTFIEYIANMVEVFRSVRNVLRDDGTLWVNLGDSYNAHPGQRKTTDKAGAKQSTNAGSPAAPSRHVEDLKPKDLIGIPWRVAFALQSDGWYLRQDIIWHKPNPMPESVKDRCTKAHEYVFLLSKSDRYFFDSEAIKEPSVQPDRAGKLERNFSTGNPVAVLRQDVGRSVMRTETRNRRSVWTVPTKPYKGAHFATFPPALIEPCILAGSPKGGTVLDPFGGSGTTGAVALSLGRKAALIELNGEYVDLAVDRLASGIRAATEAVAAKERALVLPGFSAKAKAVQVALPL